MSFQPLCVDVSFSWHPYLLASLFLETWDLLLLRFSSLEITFSWLGFLMTPCFSHPLFSQRFSLRHLSVKIVFPWGLLSWLLCLEAALHFHSFLFHCFPPGIPFLLAFPVLLCTTQFAQRLAQRTSEYYFVLQTCAKYFPVLLGCTKFAQSTSKYHFVLQSLHKVLPSATPHCKTQYYSYYKVCTKYFTVLLCPFSTFQYCFVEGCIEIKPPTIWTDWKAEVERVREEKVRRKKIREEKESEERRCRCAKR